VVYNKILGNGVSKIKEKKNPRNYSPYKKLKDESTISRPRTAMKKGKQVTFISNKF
jgi:hypothetical protein